MTRKELHEYWKYYLLLEKRFIETIDYIELNQGNYASFSNNYALLMQAIGAEMDTIFKIYCGYNTDDCKTIADYVRAIDDEEQSIKPQHAISFPFRNQKVRVYDYDVILQPFKDWDSKKPRKSLLWWDAFDYIKHNRFGSIEKANQKNALDLLCALFLLEMKLLKKTTEGTNERDVFDKGSDLFSIKSWSTKVVPFDSCFNVLADMIEEGENYSPTPVDS